MCTGDVQKSTLANSEDPHVMPQNVAFHQGLHRFKGYKYIITWDSLKYMMNQSIHILYRKYTQKKKFSQYRHCVQ